MVIDGEGWHRGVIGITATRVVERHGRPALVVSRDGEQAHGSGRSIRPFHLLNALESCSQLFTRYGGHSHAVGFSLPTERLPELRAQLDQYARARLTLDDLEPTLDVAAELSLEDVTPEFFHLLEKLEPFGAGNHEPVFLARNVKLLAPARVMKEKHIKLKLSSGIQGAANDAVALTTPHGQPDAAAPRRQNAGWKQSVVYDALGWRMAERWQQEQLLPGDTLDIAFTLDHNDHPEFGGLELSLRDFKAAKVAARFITAQVAQQ
jgi:single-stranded-DNA-specific exonuclease